MYQICHIFKRLACYFRNTRIYAYKLTTMDRLMCYCNYLCFSALCYTIKPLNQKCLTSEDALYGFLPIEIFLRIIGNSDHRQKRSALAVLQERFTVFLSQNKIIAGDQNNGKVLLDLTANMVSLLTLMKNLLGCEDSVVIKRCFNVILVSVQIFLIQIIIIQKYTHLKDEINKSDILSQQNG